MRKLERLGWPGAEAEPDQMNTAAPSVAAFAAFHKAEVEKWFPVVKAAGVKAE